MPRMSNVLARTTGPEWRHGVDAGAGGAGAGTLCGRSAADPAARGRRGGRQSQV